LKWLFAWIRPGFDGTGQSCLSVFRGGFGLINRERMISFLVTCARGLPLILIGVMAFIIYHYGGLASVRQAIDGASGNPIPALAIIMTVFALKSISFGIPFAFLYLTVGSMFPLFWAFIINLCGILVNLQAPYWIGRFSGKRFVQRFLSKYPRLVRLKPTDNHSGILLACMIKFIGKIPHEITNLLLGSLPVPYGQYMLGSTIGLLPVMITTTILGSTLDDSNSTALIVSSIVLVLLTVGSYLMYRRFMGRSKPTQSDMNHDNNS
jgi:uncharacterized membrane protein YdjX (TVP38/TMEM64 family)